MEYSPLDRVGRAAARVVLVVGLAVLLAPIITTVGLSISPTFSFPPTGLTLSWYADVLSRSDFVNGFRVSVLLGAWTLLVATVLGTGVAFTVARRSFTGGAALSFLFLSPVVVPTVAIGVAIFMYFTALDVRSAVVRLAIVHLVVSVPFVIVVVTASLQGIDSSIESAALNLGASPFEVFRRVTLPLIRTGVLSGALFAFAHSFAEVTASIFVSDVRTSTLPVVLWSYLSKGSLDPTAAAASSLMLFCVLTAAAVMARYVGLGRMLGIERTK